MKKRNAFVGAILSIIPFGQPFLLKTGVFLLNTGSMIPLFERVQASDSSYFFNRAYQKTEKGDYYGAISDYTKAIEINPQDGDAYNNRGNAKRKLKDNYGAIADYTKAIEIDPNDKQAYNNRGIAKEKIGDLNGACADWRKASSLGNNLATKSLRDQC